MSNPLQNGRDVLLSQNSGTLPNMSSTLLDYFQPLTFVKIVKTVVNYQLVETKQVSICQGVIQPYNAKQLEMRPTGQRAWSWFTIHTNVNLPLFPDDIVTQVDVINGNVNYRIMQKREYEKYGYYEYQVIQDYEEP